MLPISTEGFAKPQSVSAGTAPVLQWLPIKALVVDTVYRRPIADRQSKDIRRIAQTFSWARFAPVIVTPIDAGQFAIIDGRIRVTAAAVAGFCKLPCQIVIAIREEHARASRALNRACIPVSRMALHATAIAESDGCALQLAEICSRADVELLRYPVPVDRQSAGQTMAIGAIAQCLQRHGAETLITALQCVTQTANNRPGLLSARLIKAICAVLGNDRERRDRGLALLEAFDGIDLAALQNTALVRASVSGVSPVQFLADRIRSELDRLLPDKAASAVSIGAVRNAIAVGFRSGAAVPSRRSSTREGASARATVIR
jgi:ParB-like nuclease domain